MEDMKGSREGFLFPSNTLGRLRSVADLELQYGGGMQLRKTKPALEFVRVSFFKSFFLFVLFLSTFVVTSSQPGYAIPAFARKYGLPCSACHIGWPILNNFGLQFRDNGYQLGNEKDSPIYQNPSYWPITFRVTPQWHLENQTKVLIDQTGAEQSVTTHG